MSILESKGDKVSVNKAAAFCTILEGKIPAPDKLFTELLDDITAKVKREAKEKFNKTVSDGAINCSSRDLI